MVAELTELQGVMGGIYAREEGQPERVWKAIYYHYLPDSVGVDAPPTRAQLGDAAVTWAAVSLADKLDTVVGMFYAGEKPTGSRDPFGLRRQAHGIFKILVDLPALTGLTARPTLDALLTEAARLFAALDEWPAENRQAMSRLPARTISVRLRTARLRCPQRASGAAGERIRASEPCRCAEAARSAAGVHGVAGFSEAGGGVQARQEHRARTAGRRLRVGRHEDPPLAQLLKEPAEIALLQELERRGPAIDSVLESGENLRRAFVEAAQFGPAVDRFFTEIFVMVDDAPLRKARLRLMKRLEQQILRIADISEIVSETE